MIAQQLLRPTYAVAMSLYQLQYRRSAYSLYKCNLGSTYIYLRLYISATDLYTACTTCAYCQGCLNIKANEYIYRHYILYHSKHPGWYSYFSEFHYDTNFSLALCTAQSWRTESPSQCAREPQHTVVPSLLLLHAVSNCISSKLSQQCSIQDVFFCAV